MKNVYTSILCLCIIFGCERTQRKNQHQDIITVEATEIEDLIEQLAISQEPATDRPIYTPSRDTPRTDKRVIAYEAAKKLKKYGKAVFPYLLKHLADQRQSVAFRRVLPSTVGDACFCIIQEQIFPLPEDYRGSFYRTGADGSAHARPYFLEPVLFDGNTIESWLEQRKHKSLQEIQVEALQELIEREKMIGFSTENDKRQYLYPLERQLEKIKSDLR